jgi:SAM-dependent methyltransferase
VYWAKRGDGYRTEFERHSDATAALLRRQEAQVSESLTKHDLSDVNSILEIGCGFGRLTPALIASASHVQTYTGLDVSQGQIEAARQAWRGDIRNDFLVADFRSAELEKVDLVFAGEVFLHFPPNEIAGVLDRATQLARRWVVHLDPYRRVPQGPLQLRARLLSMLAARRRGHRPSLVTDWQHDFPRLHDSHTMTMHPILEGRQHLFVVEL